MSLKSPTQLGTSKIIPQCCRWKLNSRLCCYLYSDVQPAPGRLLSHIKAPGIVWILKAWEFLLFLPNPGMSYSMGKGALPLLMKREKEECRKFCFPASEIRACASHVSAITFRNPAFLPYLCHREQVLIPPPWKSLCLVKTFTNSFYFCHM